MEFADTHTHLYDEAFASDEDGAVGRAVAAGVGTLVFPDIDSSTRDAMFSLASRHKEHVFPCLGLHPTSVSQSWKDEYSAMEAYIGRTDIYAIGEIGMDLYWSRDFKEEQEEVLALQLELAHRLDLPVIIHSREATEPIINVLKAHHHSDTRGVFHAYSGSIETWRELQKTGVWYAGIGGVLTYRKASIAQTVKDIPLEMILLETDSPYLTPVPKRGTRNESSYIPFIAEKLASITGREVSAIAEITTSNARRLFRTDNFKK